MRKVLLAALTAALVTAGIAVAANIHFVGTPTCSDQGTYVTCSGKVAGLGEQPFHITVSATGVASVQCYNPHGNYAPGQDTTVTSTGSSGPLRADKNGNFQFSQSSNPPTVDSSACPNRKWTAVVTDVAFTNATITVTQGSQSISTTVPVQ